MLWHVSGLTNRCVKKGRSISGQLARMQFRPALNFDLGDLSHQGIEIYCALVEKYEGKDEAEWEYNEWVDTKE